MIATISVAVVSIAALVIQHIANQRSLDALAAMLDRVSTEPRIEVRPMATPAPRPEPHSLRYIPDTPDADTAWNEWRGEPVEVES